MNRFFVLFSFIIAVSVSADTRTGHIETFSFESELLENTRTIWVYLPPGYKENASQHYPVFYLQDGQNLMDAETAYKKGHEWSVDETAQALILDGTIEPIIIVGINHMNEERADEYNVTVEKSHGAGPFYNKGGLGEMYGYMITEELMPFIDKKYRTKTDPKDTAVGGASFGCNISLYLALEYPEQFGQVMGMSCATWFGNLWLTNTVRSLHKKKSFRIWLDVGDSEYDDEGWNQAEVMRHSDLYKAFISKGWQKHDDIFFLVEKEGTHFEDDWARRFPQVLKWFFPK